MMYTIITETSPWLWYSLISLILSYLIIQIITHIEHSPMYTWGPLEWFLWAVISLLWPLGILFILDKITAPTFAALAKPRKFVPFAKKSLVVIGYIVATLLGILGGTTVALVLANLIV